MNDAARKAFEEVSAPNFGWGGNPSLRRNKDGTYVDHQLEDHWQTFQEGWEEAVKYLKDKENESFSDMLSDGGYDPRD